MTKPSTSEPAASPPPRFFQKFRSRLLLLVLLPVVPALLLILFTGLEQRRLAVAQTRDEAVQLVRLATAREEAIIETTRQQLSVLANLTAFRGTNQALYDFYFKNFLALNPQFADCGMIDTNGILYAGALAGAPGRFAGQPFFREALKLRIFAVGECLPCCATNMMAVTVGFPMMDETREVIRVLYAAIKVEALAKATANTRLPPDSVLTVMDRRGRIVTSIPESPRRIGQSVDDKSLEPVVFARTEGVTEARGEGGEWHLCVFAPIRYGGNTGLIVVASIPREVANAAANRLLYRNLVLLALVTFLAYWAATRYASSSLLRPVESLLQASKRMAAGDLTVRTGIGDGSSELHRLALAFDEMAATVQKRQVEIQRAESQFRTLVEQSIVGIYVIQDDKFAYVNPRMEDILGYRLGELDGRRVYDFVAEADRPLTKENIDKRTHGVVRSLRYSLHMLRKDGTVIAVEVHGTTTEYHGQPAIIGTLVDITEREQARVQIERLNSELERRVVERTAQLAEANKELEAFSYSVSHDLRAPLRHIDGFVGLLVKSNGPAMSDQGRRYLTIIADSARQMGALIDDLLVFSRMNRTELRVSKVDLRPLMDEAIQGLHAETGGRNVLWKLGALPAVRGDRAMLRQVAVNLISNAVKYTRPRNPAEIEIGCVEGVKDEVVIFVRDNGVGFDMQYVDKLFGVFQRLHRAEEFEGTGIGLANVHRIVARHGGRVWAEGMVNGGATFYFSLPNPGDS